MGYEPTDKDILMLRRPTSGLIEQWIAKTDYENIQFQMVDVGGQKNERKKWIHHFENVAAICYVASLSAFDEPLYEDMETNSLQDAIELFKETTNSDSHWFKKSSLFLILNKKDLFEQKISKNLEFIKQKFLTEMKDEDKETTTFITCAYEEEQVQNVFTDVLNHIVNKGKLIPP